METESSVEKPNWQTQGLNHIWMPYCQMQTAPLPLALESTQGVHLHLSDGRTLIDGLASWWTACHGYNHPHVIAAMEKQLRKMPHVMFGGIQHEPAMSLATRLAKILPGDLNRVFFCDSGSVAVEVAMKMATQFWLNQGQSGRNRFVSFRHAYHGDTTGAMSLCDPDNSMHAHFKGFLLEQYPQAIPQTGTELQEFDRFLRLHRRNLAGVIIEPLLQGAGGMKFHSAETLAEISKTCDRHDLLLIADELATGFGRTGKIFAIEQAEIVPDIVCLGKAMTAGAIGMAATVATDRIFDAFSSDDPSHALMHGPTYMANPLACAAANASLDLFECEPRLQQVETIARTIPPILERCRKLSGVVDVRTLGAVGVIQVLQLHHLDRLRAEFIANGVFLRPFSDIIYITPSLTIHPSELVQLCETMVNVVERWSRWS